MRHERESGNKSSVEATEIAAFPAIESGSLRRAIPDVSTALLRMIGKERNLRFGKTTAGVLRPPTAQDPSPQSHLHKDPDRAVSRHSLQCRGAMGCTASLPHMLPFNK